MDLVCLLPIDEQVHFHLFKTPSDSRKSFLLFECKTISVKPVGGRKEKYEKFFFSIFSYLFLGHIFYCHKNKLKAREQGLFF